MKIACIPDTHFPFSDRMAVGLMYETVKRFKPDVIVQLGDLYDLWSFSRYPRNASEIQMTPEQEYQLGRSDAEQMWAVLKKENPKARLVQICDANHDLRLVKRMMENDSNGAFIAKQWLVNAMTFPGVELARSETVIDGIMFMHGMRKAGEHAKYNQMSTVTGHTHKCRLETFTNVNGPYWEMNCGWLCNGDSPAFSYRSQTRICNNVHAVGLIENGQPRFHLL